jgi:hemin uptake protein HemP
MNQVIQIVKPSFADGSDAAKPKGPQRFSSKELFGGECEIEIEHGDVLYRLRVTALGKLILTK